MKLNRTELRKIQYDFNSISNRLLQADFNDYLDVLGKYLNFLETTPIIYDYIVGCGTCDQDLDQDIKEVSTSYGRFIFSVGDSDEEEVRNVYAILHYIVEKKIEIHYGIAMGYSTSNKYQDKVKGFNDRFVMILIRHIERYLTKVGIDMGLDDKVIYNVTVHDGQAIIATDNASVYATSQVGANSDELTALIEAVRALTDSLSPEDKESVSESLEVIESEVVSGKPRKSMIKTAISCLKAIKGTAELGAAIATLIQFVTTL